MIRNATPADAATLAGIYNHFILRSEATFEVEPISEEEMRRRIASIAAHGPYLVDETDGVVTGYSYAHPWKERAAYARTWETTVYIAPACQHRGIGRALMQRLIDDCRRRGVHALIACITQGNAPSYALHRQLGFRQVSAFEEVGRKFDRWWGVTDWELLLD